MLQLEASGLQVRESMIRALTEKARTDLSLPPGDVLRGNVREVLEESRLVRPSAAEGLGTDHNENPSSD